MKRTLLISILLSTAAFGGERNFCMKLAEPRRAAECGGRCEVGACASLHEVAARDYFDGDD